MPEDIERTIFKLELDGSGYIAGVENLSASTKKLVAEQEKANKALLASQAVLKSNSDYLQQTKKDLDSYTGTNEKYRLQLQKTFDSANAENQKLTEIVNKNKAAYDAATKAAQDFADVSARANNLQPIPGQGKIPAGPPATIPAGITSQIAGVLNVAEFTEQAQILAQTKKEFDDLAVSITLADERMKQLNADDEEFKQLAPIVAKGKEALKQYENATKGAGEASGSLRSQIRAGKEELVKLEQAGKGATKQYFELEKQVAKLTDEFGDQQARIKILASDTKLLDFGKGAITAATSAFQVYSAVSILAGDESAELQKKTMQLFAAMQLLQSLEQLSNLTRREGVIAVHLQSASQAVYTAVVGASTGALKAFRLALLATGVGAAIVLIGFLVSKFLAYAEAVKKAGVQQRLLKEITESAIKSFTAEAVHLDLIKSKLTDLNIPQEKRIALAKEYNKTAEAGNQIDLKQIDNIDLINSAITRQIERIKARALAKASENIVTDRAEKLQLAEESAREKAVEQQEIEDTRNIETVESAKTDQYFKTIGRESSIRQKISKDATVKQAKEDLAAALDIARRNINIDDLTPPPPPPGKGKAETEIKNEFLRKKAELDQQLAELTRKEADNESKIRVEFTTRLIKEQLEIEKLLKEKKLTKPQAKILQDENVQINTLALEKALADFHKKQTDARQKLNDDLLNLQNKNTQDQLNLLQDEFDRRAQLIEFNEQKELDDAKLNITKRIAAIELDRLLIGEKAYQDAKAILITAGERNALNITRRFAGERVVLAADTFQSLLQAYDDAISNANLIRDEDQAKQLKAAKENFLAQKITYQQFQDEIKRIKDAHDRDMREGDLVVMKDQLAALDDKIAKTKDKTTKGYAELLKQQKEFRKKIAAAEAEAAQDVPPPPTVKTGDDSFEARVRAIGELANSVVQFWQAANAAESQALDRSIALQEKRVSAAQRIAERGNAQYLKAEEDRLTELNIKRENAARKQLGIDAALQASQILVGITGAIAKISTPGIGIAETIGAIAVIIGALATGYGLVKSLQGNQPKLYKGTTDVKREGQPAGVDTIPAWLTEHEAVIPPNTNKKYKKTVEAIYHGKVPAEDMNDFVENYVRNKKESKETIVANREMNLKNNEEKNLTSAVHKVYNETADKKITLKETKDFIFHENKTSDIIKTVAELVKNSVEKKKVSFESFVNENISFQDVQKYSTIVDKVLSESKKSLDFNTIIRKVVEEVTDKKLSLKEFNVLRNDQHQTSAVIKNIFSQVTDKLDNKTSAESIYSEAVNKVFAENKSLVESKNLSAIVKKVLNETVNKNISISDVQSFLDEIRDRKTSSVINTIVKLQQQKSATEDFKKSLVSEHVTLEDIHKISEIVDIKRKENTYKQFVQNVAKVPAKVLNPFIENYTDRKFFKGTTDLQGAPGIDNVPIWATRHEAIIPAATNNLYKPTIKAVFSGTIPPETLNRFVNNYHQIKAVPQPDYSRIKESAELHIGHDGRMAVLLSEQNKKLDENNELQRMTLRAMKNMAVSANIDKNGVAIIVNEYMQQMKIDKRT